MHFMICFQNLVSEPLVGFFGRENICICRLSNRGVDQGSKQRSLVMSLMYLAIACLRGKPVSQHAGAALIGYESCITCDGEQRA